jgi:hypothetical protein
VNFLPSPPEKKSENHMVAPLELKQHADVSLDLDDPVTPQTGIHEGRCYQFLSRGREAVSHCGKAAKDCASFLYGPPYPSLSTNQVKDNYLVVGHCLASSLCLGGLATYLIISEATNPSTKNSPVTFIGLVSLLGSGALGTAAVGLRIIHKTCHAPRQGAGQALLPPS